MNKQSPFPCLWFDNQAHEAANYYCQIFKDSRIISSNPMAVVFELRGQKIMALNGGKSFAFNEAVSLVITCDNQTEIDHYWEAFTKEGEEGKCGWCKDKYGASWQVVPSILGELMGDPERAPKAMYAFMQMKKMDIQKLLEL